MFAVTLTLLLTMTLAAMMAVRGSEPLTDFLNLPAHKSHRYHLNVISEADVGELKGALSNFTIDHSYKVIGERRYIFTFRSNDTDALRHLTFPPESSVTQYPVERGDEAFSMFTDDPGQWNTPDSDNSSADGILLYFDWIFDLPKDTCWETFTMYMKSAVDQFKELASVERPVEHPLIATYPYRVLMVVQIDANVEQNLLKEALPHVGGYGASKISIKRVVKI